MAALVAALAGTAIADPGATSSAITKKKVKKLVRKQINKLAPGLSVAHADTAGRAETAGSADTAATAETANTANNATNATNANAVGGVPLAGIAVARSNTGNSVCDPSSATFGSCAAVSVDLPHAGRVLLIGTAAQYSHDGGATQGNCRLLADGQVLDDSLVRLGNQADAAPGVFGDANRAYANGFSTTVVTPTLEAGTRSFTLQCNQNDPDVEFENPQITAALLGSG